MQQQNQSTTLDAPISGDRAEELAKELGHSKTRAVIKEVVEEYVASAIFVKHIKEIIDEHTGSVDFAKKVRTSLKDELDNAFSSNRYDVFQEKVKEITRDQLASATAQKELDTYIDGRIDTRIRERGWRGLTFWVPTLIGSIAAIAAVAALFKSAS